MLYFPRFNTTVYYNSLFFRAILLDKILCTVSICAAVVVGTLIPFVFCSTDAIERDFGEPLPEERGQHKEYSQRQRFDGYHKGALP